MLLMVILPLEEEATRFSECDNLNRFWRVIAGSLREAIRRLLQSTFCYLLVSLILSLIPVPINEQALTLIYSEMSFRAAMISNGFKKSS